MSEKGRLTTDEVRKLYGSIARNPVTRNIGLELAVGTPGMVNGYAEGIAMTSHLSVLSHELDQNLNLCDSQKDPESCLKAADQIVEIGSFMLAADQIRVAEKQETILFAAVSAKTHTNGKE